MNVSYNHKLFVDFNKLLIKMSPKFSLDKGFKQGHTRSLNPFEYIKKSGNWIGKTKAFT